VLAGAGGVDADLSVEVVGDADGDHVEIVHGQQVAVVGEVPGNTELACQRLPSLRAGGGKGDDLGVRHVSKRLGVQVADEPRTDDADFDAIPAHHRCHPPFRHQSNHGIQAGP
jgi:hypothetical protein